MAQSIFLLIIFSLLLPVQWTIRVSRMESAAYVPANFSSVLVYNGTCSECICRAFFSSNYSSYAAVTCYKANQTCLLFPTFLSRADIRVNTDATLTFVQISATTTASCIYVDGQCGGSGSAGTNSCCSGLSCVYKNTSYAQCSSISTLTAAMTTTQYPATTTYFNDSRRNTSTGTYWDCCKLSCGWAGKANVTSPPRTCAQDGVTTISSGTQSYCNNGSSYMCVDQQPWNVSSSLSYGFAGGYVINQGESDWCCTCYSLLFTSGAIAGKELIVQVINTAYMSDNMFALQIPGGGWGSSTNGCANQFGNSYSWGNQYGGITSRSNCSVLPASLRAGCYWRFDWFMNAYNPSARFKEVTCPSNLTAKSGCVRL